MQVPSAREGHSFGVGILCIRSSSGQLWNIVSSALQTWSGVSAERHSPSSVSVKEKVCVGVIEGSVQGAQSNSQPHLPAGGRAGRHTPAAPAAAPPEAPPPPAAPPAAGTSPLPDENDGKAEPRQRVACEDPCMRGFQRPQPPRRPPLPAAPGTSARQPANNETVVCWIHTGGKPGHSRPHPSQPWQASPVAGASARHLSLDNRPFHSFTAVVAALQPP